MKQDLIFNLIVLPVDFFPPPQISGVINTFSTDLLALLRLWFCTLHALAVCSTSLISTVLAIYSSPLIP